MAKVIDIEERKATPEEQGAFELKPPYKPTYCDFERWAEATPPERAWAIDDWIGMGHVTLLAARGGMGKSIFVQQAGTALAIGREFIAHVSHPRICLAWMGEDDDDELWRRQVAICAKFVTPIDGLRGRLMLESMIETDCTLVANIHGAGLVRTAMLRELREQIGDTKAEVVILDNIARVFAGNENDRHDVTSFISALMWAANPTAAAVILVGHTAKPVESEFSGNAAWENACRMRMWMTDKPPDRKEDDNDDADDEPKTDLRYLSKRKTNYTSKDLCVLRYELGAYTVVQQASYSPLVAHIEAEKAIRVVIAAIPRLASMGLYGTASNGSSAYLPRLIIGNGLAEGLGRSSLKRAMATLLLDGVIVRDVVGQYPNRIPKYGFKLK